MLTGLCRNTIDKFYTKDAVAEALIHKITTFIDIDYQNDLVIEPSAGNGSFVPFIKNICNNYIFIDIKPEHPEIMPQDFLKYFPHSNTFNKIHIVGNPPFGRQSSLAIKFIRHSAKFCHTISFILPKSFKKDSMRNKVPLDFHLIHEREIPETSFLLNNKPYGVPCIFQIWEKKNILREKIKKLKPKGYKFVKKEKSHHIAFRRVGVNAGNVSTETSDKNTNTHYFICFDKFNNELLQKIKDIEFSHNNTVGPRSISKNELIRELNKIVIK